MDSRVKDKYQNNYQHPKHDPIASAKNDFYFIDTEAQFVKAVAQMNKHDIVAMDLEADSMFHFSEKVCLIQMASQDSVYIIDPLAVGNLSSLSDIVSNLRIRKILHGADYDIRCLYRDFKITMNNLFDTELAGRFLGYAGTGLDALLQKKFNVTLEKKYQKKDWSQRPLPEEMIRYAANDVRYLIRLYKLLTDELVEKDRLEWVFEECDLLTRGRPNDPDDSPLFTRIKGAGRLDSRSLAVLEALLKFRVQTAKQKDRPPFKIIGNQVLLTIVQEKPQNLSQLKALGILSDNQLNRYGNSIIDIVITAQSIPKHQLPSYPLRSPHFPDFRISQKIKKLKIWRQQKADLLQMDPGVLLNNAALKTLAEQHPRTMDEIQSLPEMKNWQKKELGQEIIAVLTGGDT